MYLSFHHTTCTEQHYREEEHAVSQYNAWQTLRERALKNNGGAFPEIYTEPRREKPPTPTAIDDSDILDLSMELNATSLDDVPGDLDESGIERVPMADPGLDVSTRHGFLRWFGGGLLIFQ